ncbi:MAG TPA: hypothetical protein VN643_09555 [Pyrinomonadaceae bacterium]|nr:hypothetical protein [Pyrinomonadaceae bacterium]
MKELETTGQSSDILRQVDEFFMKTGPVQQTLRNITERLSETEIDYVVIEGMALALHGLIRPTQDVDLLLTASGLKEFQARFVGLGYVPTFVGVQKHFRDTDTGVKVEIITTGEYPGDGQPKAIAFPDPAEVAVVVDGFRVARLDTLIELKLASGMSAKHRELRDLADVQQLIEVLRLPEDFSRNLDDSVRDEYRRLWKLAQYAKTSDL